MLRTAGLPPVVEGWRGVVPVPGTLPPPASAVCPPVAVLLVGGVVAVVGVVVIVLIRRRGYDVVHVLGVQPGGVPPMGWGLELPIGDLVALGNHLLCHSAM